MIKSPSKKLLNASIDACSYFLSSISNSRFPSRFFSFLFFIRLDSFECLDSPTLQLKHSDKLIYKDHQLLTKQILLLFPCSDLCQLRVDVLGTRFLPACSKHLFIPSRSDSCGQGRNFPVGVIQSLAWSVLVTVYSSRVHE